MSDAAPFSGPASFAAPLGTMESAAALVGRTNAQPILEIDDLSISFFTRTREIPAVMSFSCSVMPGEAVGLVGESGCGKSTVALGVMQDLGVNGRVTGGSIRFKGRDLAKMTPKELREIRGSEIAMIYQEPMASLNPAMPIGRQLMEVPMIHQGASREEARTRALEVVRDVKLPDPERILDAYPHQLSGGQQQRIVIAMALMSRPSLLILDEPTTALDVTVEAAVVQLVKDLGRKYGTSMLFISHNLGLVLETCDRICVMYSGEAVERGRIEDVFDEMRHPYTQALFRSIPLPGADKNSRPLKSIPGNFPLPHERPPGCNFGPRCDYFQKGRCDAQAIPMFPVEAGDRHDSRCLRLREIDWDTPPAAAVVKERAEPGRVVLRMDDLRKYYSVGGGAFGGGNTKVVKANETLTFEAREGETLAIVGESGCGKSTFAKVLMGLETATSGNIMLFDENIQNTPIEKRNADTVSSVQMVFQNPFDTLNPSMTVGRQIIRALEVFQIGASDAERRDRMLQLLDLVKLPRAFADRMPRQLSGGQKQRVGIARAFAGGAKVVIADEPVSALDVSVQAAVTELLMDIQRKERTTLLFISHDLSIVRYLSDRVMVMYLGHVVEIGTTDQVFAPPYHPYTEALLSAVPIADTRVQKTHIVLEGEIPSAMNPPPGCPFQTRCPRKAQVPGTLCETEVPPMRELGPGHQVKCHLPDDVLRSMEPVIRIAAE
ncbi:MAG: Oligopeptide/dipeptide ABC transporter, ATP-binding protein [uncultured Rubellimicrobium sp.]|uniref:Oligopeptide/dipeptide ABC transporter, ATP-binding protein n=1 Tax=uncultured Rubellimicrobium sp. TaxID=543078 RepID=A0A6J4Q7P9_9RHOB|nr:MAG: Oligopeptide/dipeptide ABC transporter, ATP-binding protein [uncultured Rubellimicrobium sp.]